LVKKIKIRKKNDQKWTTIQTILEMMGFKKIKINLIKQCYFEILITGFCRFKQLKKSDDDRFSFGILPDCKIVITRKLFGITIWVYEVRKGTIYHILNKESCQYD